MFGYEHDDSIGKFELNAKDYTNFDLYLFTLEFLKCEEEGVYYLLEFIKILDLLEFAGS